MNKLQKTLLLILLFTASTIFSQDKESNFGIKGGANLSKYTPDTKSINYKNKFGFYVGGFYRAPMDGKWRFQPELLFALQGSKIKTLDNAITDVNGNPLPFTGTFDFEYEVHELTITIPLSIKLYVSEGFYFESGPQFGLIIDRKITSSQYLLDGDDNSFVKENKDNFDFGVFLGMGYDVSKNVTFSLRAFKGLIKRDNDIKSFILNFGMEYNL